MQPINSTPPELPGNRSFGLLFGGLLLLGAADLQWHGRTGFAVLALAVAIGLLLLAMVSPDRLAPLNRAWFALGLALARVVNPLVLGVLFFVLVTPYAIVLRLMRRDALRLRLDPGRDSYWIERNPAGPAVDSLEKQY